MKKTLIGAAFAWTFAAAVVLAIARSSPDEPSSESPQAVLESKGLAKVGPAPARSLSLNVTFELEVGGTDIVVSSAQGLSWIHRNGKWPQGIRINGVEWDPQTQNVLLTDGRLEVLRKAELASAQIVEKSGRGQVTLEHAKDGLRLRSSWTRRRNAPSTAWSWGSPPSERPCCARRVVRPAVLLRPKSHGWASQPWHTQV